MLPFAPVVLGYIFFGGGVVMAYPQFRQGALALRKDGRSLIRKVKRRVRRVAQLREWVEDGEEREEMSRRGREGGGQEEQSVSGKNNVGGGSDNGNASTVNDDGPLLMLAATPTQAVQVQRRNSSTCLLYRPYLPVEIRARFPQLATQIPILDAPSSSQDPAVGVQRAIAAVISWTQAYASSTRAQHRFFVLLAHPKPLWRAAFAPLLGPGLAAGTDLFALLRLMLCMRADLADQLGTQAAREVEFHVLVPTETTMVIPQRLRLDRMLLPLTIEGGTKSGVYEEMGDEMDERDGERLLVWVNLDRGEEDGVMLRGVGNLAALPGGFEMGDADGGFVEGLEGDSRDLFASVEGICV